MDWSKLFDIGMVQSAVRWMMTAWGSSAFMADWVSGNASDWNAIVAGAVAVAGLLWSFMTVKVNK